MLRPCRLVLSCFAAVALMVTAASPLAAQAADRLALVAGLCGDSAAIGIAAKALLPVAGGASDDDRAWAAPLARAALDRKLTCDTAGGVLGLGGASLDALARTPRDAAPDGRSPTLNLRNRGLLETAEAALALRTSPDPGRRAGALRTLERHADTLPDGLLEGAAAAERDSGLKKQILAVGVAAALNSKDTGKRIAALAQVADDPNGRAMTSVEALLSDPAYAADPAFKAAVDGARGKIARGVAIGNALATLYNGLSFASILFMAAIGLAVIFGLMGVINLAQGEFIMIGAYATWLVQEGLQRVAPNLVDYYLLLAIPVAFLAAAAVGIALEVTLLRHLYKRPLMSLLATWAVSLFLVNLVRVVFGTQNLQFVMPSYVTGGVPVIGDFIITWNRLFAIGFAAVTLALTFAVIRLTPFGLAIRAVTQNRTMAGCIGVPVRRVDMLAFGLGSGLAGLAGLALAPIYSVNPLMGQGFIIDSFMVVVLGGVGTVVGPVVAALGIGQVNVLIEPLGGAVAAKVIVLLMIIAFLQWRPEGLFVVKGRRK